MNRTSVYKMGSWKNATKAGRGAERDIPPLYCPEEMSQRIPPMTWQRRYHHRWVHLPKYPSDSCNWANHPPYILYHPRVDRHTQCPQIIILRPQGIYFPHVSWRATVLALLELWPLEMMMLKKTPLWSRKEERWNLWLMRRSKCQAEWEKQVSLRRI